eukprot:CAMPEP_0204299384 /NCGR_PEP_ID=MMETSP0468-20130131/76663_1 /ASSEMBLY_ACC=CAM_ASM_000383 /TAXON_ID=2969 /ORGANISM="Oxyrrhis marina" /LENGTH=61 /DNA_ID=CAMNT_0051278359 /DNA_START=424 /DNA_END=605 /DNA_ORIENTATION=-
MGPGGVAHQHEFPVGGQLVLVALSPGYDGRQVSSRAVPGTAQLGLPSGQLHHPHHDVQGHA